MGHPARPHARADAGLGGAGGLPQLPQRLDAHRAETRGQEEQRALPDQTQETTTPHIVRDYRRFLDDWMLIVLSM